MNLSYLILGRQDYQSSIKENKHFKLNMSLSISTFYVIIIIIIFTLQRYNYYFN